MKVPSNGEHAFSPGMLANDLAEAMTKYEYGPVFGHIGDDDVEAAIPAFLAALPSSEGERVLPIGTVLRSDSPEPPDGTVLMLSNDTVERYDSSLALIQFGGWRRYALEAGPFVVVPDFDALVSE